MSPIKPVNRFLQFNNINSSIMNKGLIAIIATLCAVAVLHSFHEGYPNP
jgi:tetrahydromethanopterin S-methyltransferase subunit C